MLRPRKITVHNFMSYIGTHSYTYPNGVQIIQGVDFDSSPPGSIGSGKTALAGYAPTWCVFGKLPVEGYQSDDVVNRYVGAPTWVKWELEDATYKVEITRTKTAKKTQLEILINGEVPRDYPADLPNKNQWLLEYLCIDWDLWNSIVFLSPSSKVKSFLDLSPTSRMSVLSKGGIIDDAHFQEGAKLLHKQYTDIDRQIMLLEGERNVIVSTIERIERERTILEDNMSRESERVRGAEELVRIDTEAMEMEILRLQDEMRKAPSDDTTRQIQIAIGDISRTISEQQSQLNLVNHQLMQLPTFQSPTCSSCGQSIAPAKIIEIQMKGKELTEQRVVLQRQLTHNSDVKADYHRQYEELQRWPDKKRQLQSTIDELKFRAYASREGIDNSLLIQYTNQINVMDSHLETYASDNKRVEDGIAEKRDQLMKIKVVRDGFSKEIRFMMVDSFKKLMSFFANEDLQLLGRDGWGLAFSTEKGEHESFIIEPQYQGDRMELPSKGQRHKFSLACTSAFIKSVYHTRPHKVGMLVIDDPIGDLDENGQRELGILLQDLSESIPVVLVTVPQDFDLGAFPVTHVHFRNQESSIDS